ncbi:DUF308 domain-containing protein [Mycobacterium sp. OTB74]|uniref:DUF308 domain-containing protein n=1 Tax=Mycobacterium sp. OTB74 TaxID=1853452 RepID=UPI002476696C|nr:DUF308 domain-containing protein [Mycobacterium sp. OTB74]MDH6247384.1 uncharacterized membrane protein HdeD (DUF308 family) [Mycobacterium sp. OTB74]
MDQSGPTEATPAKRQHDLVGHLTDSFLSKSRYWWVFLIAGAVSCGIAVVILRFTFTTIEAIATLFAVVCLLAAAGEAVVGALASRGWRVARWSLALVFVVAAIVAFLAVKATIVGLSAVMGAVLILRGFLGVMAAIAARRERGSKVLLIAALAELAIGSLVAASLQGSITALLAWVAAGTAAHAVAEISSAFLVRRVGRSIQARHA